MNKIVCVVLAGLILAGCATQRPQMSEDQYQSFARTWATIGFCNNKGWIDSDTAARGQTYVNSAVGTYTFDRDRMGNALAQVGKAAPPSQEDCRMLSMNIHQRKQQIENQNAQNATQQQEAQKIINSTKSTQTYCNKIGTQVLCNSY